MGAEQLVAQLIDRLVDYRAQVRQVGPDQVAAAIAAIAAAHAGDGARLVVAADFPAQWRHGWTAIEDVRKGAAVPGQPGLTATDLDGVDGAVTTCTVAVAETGTLVLDGGPGQGRRAITLVPDLHVCVVRRHQVVQTVPDALRRLDPTRPLTFVSGPSATSDIELQRVEGVHGPRTLHVLVVDEGLECPAGDC